MRISDWSSDVCSSDLHGRIGAQYAGAQADGVNKGQFRKSVKLRLREAAFGSDQERGGASPEGVGEVGDRPCRPRFRADQTGPPEIGRASCRERGWQNGSDSVGAGECKKQNKKH